MKPQTAIKQITNMGFHAWHHEGQRDVVQVSAEHGDGAADYYGEFGTGDPTINPKLEAWAKRNGLYFEWDNPGSISAWPA